MAKTSYVIALGCNRRHGRHGAPAAVIRAALADLATSGVEISVASPILATPPLGPAGRAFANAAALVRTVHSPAAFLSLLKSLEASFGRRPGRRWGPRVLDLDIILWSGGLKRIGRRLTIPHAEYHRRAFVLDPLVRIVPFWRDPRSGLTVRQTRARLRKSRSVDQAPPGS